MAHISVEGRTFNVSESVEAVTRALGNDGRGVFKDADHPEESVVIDLAGLGWARVSEEPRQPPAEPPKAVSTGQPSGDRGSFTRGAMTWWPSIDAEPAPLDPAYRDAAERGES